MATPFTIDKKEYATIREAASVFRDILENEKGYNKGSSGIESDFQELPDGFKGAYKGHYVEKGFKRKAKANE